MVNAAVPLLTLSMDRSQFIGQARRRLQTGVLRLLLAGLPQVVESVAADLWNGLPAAPVAFLHCRGTRYARSAALDRLVQDRRVATARVLFGELDGSLVCIVAAEAGGPEPVLRVLRAIEGLRVGVSEPAGYDDLERARAEAGRAVSYGEDGAKATWFRDVPRLGLLDLLPESMAAEYCESVLRPLRDGAGVRQAELLGSLAVWLAHHGQWGPAAAELGVHRHTLRHRMQKAERLLGRRLDSADLRAEMWVALQMYERLHQL